MNIKFSHLLSFFLLSLCIAFSGCKKEGWKDATGAGPTITIDKTYETIAGLNVGDQVTIPVNVKAQSGIKRFAYYFIMTTANGTQAGTPVYIDKPDLPASLDQDIVFIIEPAMAELVIVSFNKENRSSELHISISEIRSLPTLSFKDGINYQENVFENKLFTVEGTIASAHDLGSITYQTIINDVASGETAISFTDKKNTPFAASVTITKGISAIIIKAKNIYDGAVVDTFKIGNVAEDDMSIVLAGGATTINTLYADSANTISGNASSGSDIAGLSYAVKTSGSYGAEQTIPLGTPLDQFSFSFAIAGAKEIEAVRISGHNTGGKSKVMEIPVVKVYTRLLHFTDIKLTTEIGPGKHNWFSAYQQPHVFDNTTAAANQMMLDFAFIKYTAVANRIVPAAVFNASAAYTTATAPYMVGFSKATYAMVTANRPSITPASFSSLGWDGQMTDFINNKIKAPTSEGGENYNVSTANRRVSGDMVPGAGFVIGWGSWNFADSKVDNQAFGVVIVKEYSEANGFANVTLEIKVPADDNRTKYNPVSLFNYP
jgi:hypothetical protein